MENASAVVEGALITVGVGLILYRAVDRLQTGGEVQAAEVGIAAMVVSLAVNLGVSWHLGKVAERHGSVALKAAASHRLSDVFTSLAVLAGLALVKVTDIHIIDPIVAIIVAALVLRMAVFSLVWPSAQVLLDVSLPAKQQEAVLAVLQTHRDRYVTYRHLRTRSAGRHRDVAFTLVVPPQMSVLEAHDVCDLLERDIKDRLPNTTVTIHVEPGDHTAAAQAHGR